ncbi:hypothetical protein B0A50_01336 [Salinomyces thailandicus]|uniref:Uncharacterized protein n=1 Tax=Salinomyces thailandicus TaxID=706561 RepID=A0A4V5N5N0_9PEZI|nr:hypothetical protein B0A50_01336 [Salinomyces thailandica]
MAVKQLSQRPEDVPPSALLLEYEGMGTDMSMYGLSYCILGCVGNEHLFDDYPNIEHLLFDDYPDKKHSLIDGYPPSQANSKPPSTTTYTEDMQQRIKNMQPTHSDHYLPVMPRSPVTPKTPIAKTYPWYTFSICDFDFEQAMAASDENYNSHDDVRAHPMPASYSASQALPPTQPTAVIQPSAQSQPPSQPQPSTQAPGNEIPDEVLAIMYAIKELKKDRRGRKAGVATRYPSRNTLKKSVELEKVISRKTGCLMLEKKGGLLRRWMGDERLFDEGWWRYLTEEHYLPIDEDPAAEKTGRKRKCDSAAPSPAKKRAQ